MKQLITMIIAMMFVGMTSTAANAATTIERSTFGERVQEAGTLTPPAPGAMFYMPPSMPSGPPGGGPDSTPIPGRPGSPGPDNPGFPGGGGGSDSPEVKKPLARIFYDPQKSADGETVTDKVQADLPSVNVEPARFVKELKDGSGAIYKVPGGFLGMGRKLPFDVHKKELPAILVKDKDGNRVHASSNEQLSVQNMEKVITDSLKAGADTPKSDK